jgi:hypothetical protein
MEWDFYKRGSSGDASSSITSRIAIEGDRSISALEIFVREVLQNALDAARGGDSCVNVDFRFHHLEGDRKKQFLQGIGWKDLSQHIGAANKLRQTRKETVLFAWPDELRNRNITVLEIADRGTIGLVGRDRITALSEEARGQDDQPNAYVALARDDARREKARLGAGGTYGLGKAALWAASSIQTVFFFSRLATPWNGTEHRLAGQSRLTEHYLEDGPYRGLGYAGQVKGGWCQPICNQDACTWMQEHGFGARDTTRDAGTTILIPFWDAPEGDDDDLVADALIVRYAARYFWPAIHDGRLEVTSQGITGHRRSANDSLVHYQPYIDLYSRIKTGKPAKNDAATVDLTVAVPAGPEPLDLPACATLVRAGMATLTDGTHVIDIHRKKVACIRGQGMVVGYVNMTGEAGVRPFIGVVLAGRTVDPGNTGMRNDMLLGHAEYVTHTRWDQHSEPLKHWKDSRPAVRRLLEELRLYFEHNSAIEVEVIDSDTGPMEEGLAFPGSGRRGAPPEAVVGDPMLRLVSFERQGCSYRFEVSAKCLKGMKPCHLELWIEAGRESGGSGEQDRLPVQLLNLVPKDLEYEKRAGRLLFSIPSFTKDTHVTVRGRTEVMDADVFALTTGALRAKIVGLKGALSGATKAKEEGDDQG